MNYHVYKSEEKIGEAVATIISSQILKKKNSVIGLATGSTPLQTYQYMVKLYKEGVVDYSQVTTYNLDEYCGLPVNHEQSYHYFMMTNLFRYINVPKNNIHLPDGLAANIEASCKAYDEAIEKSGGIDIQLLGIGGNGHIAFNEPGDTYVFGTHQAVLSEETIEANKRFFTQAADVPRYAVTMGIGSIMKAKTIVLIATGKAKAEAVKNMIQQNPTPACPASVLQFHRDTIIVLDEEAASLLEK